MRTPSEGSSRSLMLSQRLERLLRNCPKLLQCQVLHTTCLSSRPPLPLTVAHVTASQSTFERQGMLDVEALTAAHARQVPWETAVSATVTNPLQFLTCGCRPEAQRRTICTGRY